MTIRVRVLFVVLFAAGVLAGQELSPKAREVLGRIVSDPRFKDTQKYVAALEPAAKLKTSLLEGERLAGLNYVYGWELPADGGWPVERINDVMFEIVMSPRYDHDVFLEAVETGAPLLRSVRERGCTGAFNGKLGLSLPESGGPPFAQAEKFLYDVVAQPEFNAARVLADVCRDAVPKRAPAEPVPAPPARMAATAAEERPEGGSVHLQARATIIGGGAVVLVMLALLFWSVMRDRS